MRKILLVCGMATCFLFACKKQPEAPFYTLSDGQLANLILDVQLTEAALGEVSGERRDSLKYVFWTGLEKVYKHPVDILEQDVRTLESDPEKLNLVMNRVQALLDSLR